LTEAHHTPSPYQELLKRLRNAFPSPVSDPVHDGYVVFSLLRALDQVDSLKSDAPIVGSPREPDYAFALAQRLAESPRTVESVIPELVNCLQGMLIWGHPRSQVNVVSFPSIPSIIGVVLPSMYNPNLCSDETGRGFSEAEVRVASIVSDLVGYHPGEAGGVFTFGGTGTLLYGAKIGLEKAVPDCMRSGIREAAPVAILASDKSHYAVLNVAGWLGIGHDQVVTIPTRANNAIDLDAFESILRATLSRGHRVAAIVATMGTTDAFGVDDLGAMHAVRERCVEEFQLRYRPHLHADAVIGWAWTVFNDYDYQRNPLGFRGRSLRAIAAVQKHVRHLSLADSIGIDFHKTGFAPYVSSMLLIRDRADFQRLVRDRESMPYLYHSGEYHPGMFTLETTRGAAGTMSSLANLLLLGKDGFRALLGHAVEMAELLRELVAARPELTVVNEENYGPVTLFRAYPEGVDTFSIRDQELHDPDRAAQVATHNDLNRRIYGLVHREALNGKGVAIGFTENYRQTASGVPLVAMKSYVLSPFADQDQMKTVIDHVLAARSAVLSGQA